MQDSTESKGRGEFFAVGRNEWENACKLGVNPATAFLVMACGTGPDNSTTSWSAQAIAKYSGMSWGRAKQSVKALVDRKCLKQGGTKARPQYKLCVPKKSEELIWLPNTLVTAAGDETPPVARLRQTREIEVLQTLVELYGEHDLAGDGGLPRHLIYKHYEREKVMDIGQYVVYGFDDSHYRYCNQKGPLSRFCYRDQGVDDAWVRLKTLEEIGLLEWVLYLAEDKEPDAELLHPVGGDEHGDKVRDALVAFEDNLPAGFEHEAENYGYLIPIIRHMANAWLVEVCRLRYRPHTSMTSKWHGQHLETCREYAATYERLSKGNLRISA